jgi:general secretion pathway protein G
MTRKRHFIGPTNLRRLRAAASPGYTLVELLVVLTIISLIVGLVGPRVLNYLGESKVKTARLQIESFSSALDLFYVDTGRYPSSAEGLNALVQRPSGLEVWNGPYLKGGRVPADPWSNPYQYRAPVDRVPPYEIVSFGSDGHEGGAPRSKSRHRRQAPPSGRRQRRCRCDPEGRRFRRARRERAVVGAVGGCPLLPRRGLLGSGAQAFARKGSV